MGKSNLTILIVEDQEAIALNMADFLEGRGHILDFASNGVLGLKLALENHYDVVILDLTLPAMDGLEVCQNIREKARRHVPILMLTARDTVADKVAGFNCGADDYLTKPFALEELEVRCIALSRRYLLLTDHILTLGSVTIDRRLKLVTRNGQPIHLNHTGYQIVEYLAEAYPQVVTRSELIQKIWGDEPTETDALRSHIYQVRTLLDKPFEGSILKTVHGIGFALLVSQEKIK
ncbi:MAG: response regulator transcription factor [Hyphomicrobiales bacterium]